MRRIIRARRLTMSYQDVLAFVKENPVCFIATSDGDQPRVRGFLTVLFNDGKLYFTTGTMKSVYGQLSANPNIELCYCSRDFRTMLRVSGKIEMIDDREKKQQLLNERDYLKHFGGKVDDPRFILLRLSHGKARFWTIQQNMRESEIPVIEF
jgi:pyridoxamine 5'-phosphate oxidase